MKINLYLFATMVFASIAPIIAQAQATLATSSRGGITLASPKGTATIYYQHDPASEAVVKTTAGLLADDIELVSGRRPTVEEYTGGKLAAEAVIIGTLHNSPLIAELARKGKIDLSGLEGKWESYLIAEVANPAPGCRRAIVVAGSDRRGAAYGALSISEAIGVSPWYWWADAPVTGRGELRVAVREYLSPEPSVRYRGIFINDEDWGLLRWARHTFDPELGNIGPKTYDKVCELLLRLKANYLCPAMHEASIAFNAIPENKLVADAYGIVMGSVHCEPLLFNNASEWDKATMGEWDYVKNKDGINSVLRRRVEENSAYENVYTLALRGLHDRGMTGSSDMKERVAQLEGALMDQRRILEDVIGVQADRIPQAFTPYKEVLEVYQQGLRLPDDVTIVWADDNYGYMKQLSSPRERLRSGRSGVYYHASYLGKPHDYLWFSSTSPALMYEELRKAYDTTADRLWLLNSGDIKGCERAVDLFLAMAYDIDSFDYSNIATYEARMLSNIYGTEYYDDLLEITATFYDLAFSRRPELMGWGYQWATDKHGRERTTDTGFSFTDYREAERRLEAYTRIGRLSEGIRSSLEPQAAASFFQMLGYPVRGAELLNKMILAGQKNRWYADQGRAAANTLKTNAKAYHDSLDMITRDYNSLLGGKWNHMMTMRQGFASSYFELPATDSVATSAHPEPALWAEGENVLRGAGNHHALPSFNPVSDRDYFFEVYNKGGGILKWEARPSAGWIRLDKTSGETPDEERIHVGINWDAVPAGEQVRGWVDVSSGEWSDRVLVSVFNPKGAEGYGGLWIEDNGCIAIPAAGFHRKTENDDILMTVIENLGFEGRSVMMGHPLAPVQRTAGRDTPRLEYDFVSFSRGMVDVYTYMLPTFPISPDRGYAGHETSNLETRYGVAIDEGPVMNPTTSSFEYAQSWYENVLRNCSVKKTTLYVDRPGRHTLKIICGDPGLVVQKIVLDFGGMKRSYTGPVPVQAE